MATNLTTKLNRPMRIPEMSEKDKLLLLLSTFDGIGEREYFNSQHISHSKIVDFEENGPRVLDPTYIVEQKASESIVFGQLVDTLLTDPASLLSRFVILKDDNTITPAETKLFQVLYDNGYDSTYFCTDDAIDKILIKAREAGYYAHYTDKTLKAKIRELDVKYSIFCDARFKTIVTSEQYMNAVKCITALEKSPIFSRFLDKENAESDSVLYQVILRYGNLQCKFDMLYIDHKQKVIYPFDLKTTGEPEIKFPKSFKKFKYYRQAELYMYILTKLLEESGINYTVDDFRFIVVNKDTLTPLLYKFPIVYETQPSGNIMLRYSKYDVAVPVHKIIDEIKWYREMGQYEYPKEVYLKLCEQQSLNDKSEIIDINLI